eukprot:s111_g64.t5
MSHGKDTNPGPAPFSEPETRLLRSLVSEYKPTTYLCVHSGTLGLYMPWAFDQVHAADRNQKLSLQVDLTSKLALGFARIRPLVDVENVEIQQISKAMMSVLEELDRSHCQCPYGAAGKEVGYSCPGTSLDWIYDKLQTPFAFAFEIYVGNGQMPKLKERWHQKVHASSLLQTHLANARPDFFKAHPSDFIQVSHTEVAESENSRDCFELYNPASEEVFHATVKNWVTVYLEMAQKVSKHLPDGKGA